jgi:pescadillo protein
MLFSGLKFFVSREVNKEIFEFLIKSFDGECCFSLENFDSEIFKQGNFTHIVTDRDISNIEIPFKNVEIVQPQWICDSINFSSLLPIREYQPGKKLPPHLSPFSSYNKTDFIPQRLKEIKKH